MKRLIYTQGKQAALQLDTREGGMDATITWQDQPPRSYALQALEVEPGVYSVLVNGRAYEARTVRSLDGWKVEIAGRLIPIELEDPREVSGRRKTFGGEGRQSLKSPMPGKVVRVLVEEGATVEQGQGLVVVEAMKMQNEMKAPKAGTVIALAARVGSSVVAGEVLVTLE